MFLQLKFYPKIRLQNQHLERAGSLDDIVNGPFVFPDKDDILQGTYVLESTYNLSPEFDIFDYDLQRIQAKAEQVKQNSETSCFGGGCEYLADQIEEYLIEAGDPEAGIRIKLDSGRSNGRIVHNNTKNVIGISGFHEGIIVKVNGENLVIDPIYTDGIKESEWIKKFSSQDGSPLNVTKRQLGE